MIRSRLQDIEEGERPSKYFLSEETSRNAKPKEISFFFK